MAGSDVQVCWNPQRKVSPILVQVCSWASLSSVNCADSGPTARIVFSPVYPDHLVAADGGEALVQEEGEHCMVLHGLKRYPDVHLKWLPSLCCEKRRQLVHLLVILDDGCEALRPCVLAECAEVLSQEVLWHETGGQYFCRARKKKFPVRRNNWQ